MNYVNGETLLQDFIKDAELSSLAGSSYNEFLHRKINEHFYSFLEITAMAAIMAKASKEKLLQTLQVDYANSYEYLSQRYDFWEENWKPALDNLNKIINTPQETPPDKPTDLLK